MTIQPFPHLKQPPSDPRGWPAWLREAWVAINNILAGKQNVISEVTLTANTTTTTLTDSRISVQSVISLMPTTANAAAEAWYIGTQTTGSAIITHANAVSTDRTFKVSYFG